LPFPEKNDRLLKRSILQNGLWEVGRKKAGRQKLAKKDVANNASIIFLVSLQSRLESIE
jgi:hypothetical protein